MPLLGTRAAGSVRGFGFLARVVPPVTESAYTTPGTYSWICPAGVTSVCAVVIGGGGGGSSYSGFSGGNLAWKNNISVTPGSTYTVVVGAGGGGGWDTSGNIGGQSYFINTSTLQAYGGNEGSVNPPYVGDGGGQGGSGGTFWAGGGAGGYTGNGGRGGNSYGNVPGAGSGGGGGGGGSGLYYIWDASPSQSYQEMRSGAGGGGTSLLGQGANGAAGSNALNFGTGGGAGSNSVGSLATNGGNVGAGGNLAGRGGDGGGGGGNGSLSRDLNTYEYFVNAPGGNGGPGAVRIIWGAGRSFPSTNTGNV